MVDYLEAAPEMRILVLQGVVTMRASGHYLFNAVFFNNFDVAFSELLKEVLVTQTTGRVATAAFLGAEDAEAETHLLHQYG